MTRPTTNKTGYGSIEQLQARLDAHGQGHLLRWWPELTEGQRDELLRDITSIDWPAIQPLIESHVLNRPRLEVHGDLHPAHVFPKTPHGEQVELYRRARDHGRDLLRAGRVAAFTVAGGQGTRLGFDGPKGALPVTPVGNVTLFELFADMVKAARAKYGAAIPWFIMTSPANHEQTLAFFDKHGYFGLSREDVGMFAQGMMPAFDHQGRLILEQKHRLALAPDGHGGSLKALVRSGALERMRKSGIEIISYFQVDNPLVKPFDPLFLGLHALTGSEMSTKVCPKADDLERVGNVCLCDGRVTVIEYSDFPESLARARNPDGSRRFDAGNLAIHLLSVAFVDRIVGQSFRLPFRRADKVVPFVNEHGTIVRPTSPNAVKLEMFVFDALPLARNPLVLEVERSEEFSPVKNATGVDSLETSQRDQIRRAYRWLEAAGLHPPRDAQGEPTAKIVIMPSYAMEIEEVIENPERVPSLSCNSIVLAREVNTDFS